jgi:hypothetical protein
MSEDGIPIESFNLNEERKLGRFDEVTGGFHWAKKNEQETDEWLDTLDENVIYTQGGYKSKYGKKVSSKMEEEEEEVDMDALRERMLHFMEPAETVVEAMQRLGQILNQLTHKRTGTYLCICTVC